MKEINWYNVEVLTANIQPTDKNYKIRNALGAERLAKSLELFGLAGSVVCNWQKSVGDVKSIMLVDGNSRLEKAMEQGKKKIWVSVPDRKLTPKEFREMSAMFDLAKAGDVDMERIQGDIGKTKDFYDQWNLKVPASLLNKLGSKQLKDYRKEKANKKTNSTALKVGEDRNLNDVVMIQLIYSKAESETFRKIEAVLAAKFKTKTTMATTLQAYHELVKLLKLKV